MTDHFFPLWSKNVPKFGIVHVFLLGVRATLSGYHPLKPRIVEAIFPIS